MPLSEYLFQSVLGFSFVCVDIAILFLSCTTYSLFLCVYVCKSMRVCACVHGAQTPGVCVTCLPQFLSVLPLEDEVSH